MPSHFSGNFSNVLAGGGLVPTVGKTLYVNGASTSGGRGGYDWENSYLTIQSAIDDVEDGGQIVVAPGEYEETLTIPRTASGIRIVAVGGRGSAWVVTPTTNGTTLTNLADDVTIVNLGIESNGTGKGLLNYGDRLRCYGCKFEGPDSATGEAVRLTLATVAQDAAGTHGTGADVLFEDCEFAWAGIGVRLAATDYGAVTSARFKDCRFHNVSAASFEETGGSVDIRYRNLVIDGNIFERLEDGTEPTAYILLNDDNGNKGVAARNTFPSAINGGKNLVSTGLFWVSNYHTGGISTGQPS